MPFAFVMFSVLCTPIQVKTNFLFIWFIGKQSNHHYSNFKGLNWRQISCSPDPTTNSETTKSESSQNISPIRTSLLLCTCWLLFVCWKLVKQSWVIIRGFVFSWKNMWWTGQYYSWSLKSVTKVHRSSQRADFSLYGLPRNANPDTR